MNNKKSLLRRLLMIYITLFVICICGVLNSFAPFMTGFDQGLMQSEQMREELNDTIPQRRYMLFNVPMMETFELHSDHNRVVGDKEIAVIPATVYAVVSQPFDGEMSLSMVFSVIGDSPLAYALTMVSPLLFFVALVFMFVIVYSVRKSIKAQVALSASNTWRLRIIGMLVILSEVLRAASQHMMTCRAAELIDNVNTTIDISYSALIMGLMVIFSAELFALCRNLSEEQKLTI